MNCEDFAENIVFYLDGELSPAARKRFDHHKTSCPNCQALFTEVAATYQTIATAEEVPASPFFYHKLQARLAREQTTQQTGRVISLLKPLAVAASIGLGIIIGNGELEMLLNQDNELEVAAQDATLATPADYSVWVTLNEDYGSEN